MSDIFVPPNDREVFEEQFIELHPALNLKATSNSGAYWGDGDARPQARKQDSLTYAVEMKTRQGRRLTPKPSEYTKALKQLSKFDSDAIRIIAVYSLEKETYAASLPIEDWNRLTAKTSVEHDTAEKKLIRRRKGPNLPYRYLKWIDWKTVYKSISESQ